MINLKWLGPLGLLAALVIGDQIRIHRPGHKYRLTIEVETPDGVRSGAGVLSVHPDRGYSRNGSTVTRGDAVLVDLGGGKNLLALLAHRGDKGLDLAEVNFVALRAYNAAGHKTSFKDISRMTGAVPVTGSLIPVLATFTDLADPRTMRETKPDDLTSVGQGFRLRGVSAEVVPNGLWPIDFGGWLGEPVTRGIGAKLPWLNGPADAAATALQAAGLAGNILDAKAPLTRK